VKSGQQAVGAGERLRVWLGWHKQLVADRDKTSEFQREPNTHANEDQPVIGGHATRLTHSRAKEQSQRRCPRAYVNDHSKCASQLGGSSPRASTPASTHSYQPSPLKRGRQLARTVLCLALVMSCVSPIGQAALEVRTVEAGVAGWELAGLPDPGRCWLDAFQVEFADTESSYADRCPADSWACLAWQLVDNGRQAIPSAVLHPSVRGPAVERQAVHELMHLLHWCAYGTHGADHARDDVWLRNGTPVDSAEEYARDALAAGGGP
jgi:hypothetical protein